MNRADRGVSTVVDVALALVLISASVLVLAAHFEGTDDEHEPMAADRTAETLAATTIGVQYSLAPVTEADEFVEPESLGDDGLERADHGPAVGLLADAAVTNVRIGDEPLTAAGAEFEESVDGATREHLVGADRRAHVVATWRPHDGSSIAGEATAGRAPPPTADVSVAATTVSSGLPSVDEERLAGEIRDDGIDGAAAVIAETVVEGYVPPEASQHALESQGIDRALTVYRYERFAAIVGADLGDPDDDEPISRVGADAAGANEELADELADRIAADLEATLENDLVTIREEYDGAERDERIAAAVTDVTAIEEATVTVHTWDQ